MSEPMYPHLKDTAIVKNKGYNGHFFVWQHIDGRVCQASTNTAAERQFELHGVMASTPKETVIDAEWMAGVWPTLPEIAY